MHQRGERARGAILRCPSANTSFVSCSSQLLIQTLDQECGSNQFDHWFTYFAIACWLPTVSFWLSRMNTGLAYYSPLLIIPLLQVRTGQRSEATVLPDNSPSAARFARRCC